jgi:hypothetical protein
MNWRRAGITFALVGVAVAGTACSDADPADTTARGGTTADNPRSSVGTQKKTGTGDLRHDLEPLTKRFTALGDPVSATWQSGTLASAAPGPTTYWIDAVVELTPEVATALRTHETEPTSETPEVVAAVRAAIPSGPLRHGADLDAAFAQGSFRAKVYLVEGTDTVVLTALGE